MTAHTLFHPAVASWFEQPLRRADRGAGGGLAGDPVGPQCADRGADRFRQDARRLPRGHRQPGAAGARGRRSRTRRRSSMSRRSRRSPTTSTATSRSRSPASGRQLRAQGLPRCRDPSLRCGPATRRRRARPDGARPPHIVVTTPESLYILLGSRVRPRHAGDHAHRHRRRDPCRGASKRGSHLALSLERLAALAAAPPLLRIGLSATQKPIEEVAHFLVGAGRRPRSPPGCTIIDIGHRARSRPRASRCPARRSKR